MNILEMPLITVVVPCYNSGDKLNNVLTSLRNQTYPASRLQIITVDDHSSDNTLSILKENAESFPNFEVFSCRSKGVSEARNTGIENAKGEYIAFVDADDIVSPYHIENLYNIIKKTNTQLAVISYTKVKHTAKYSKIKFKKRRKEKLFVYDKIETAKRFLTQKIEFCVWNKLYITEILRENNIEFNKNCRYNEDSYFNYLYIKQINNAVCDEYGSYYYVQSKNSLVRQKFKESRLDMYLSLNAIVNDAYANFTEVKEYSHSIRALMACELILWIYRSSFSNHLVLNKILSYFSEDVSHLKNCKHMARYRRLLIPIIPPLAKLLLRKRLKPRGNEEYTLPMFLN